MTDVYVCLDFPATSDHEKGYNEICKYLASCNLPFKSLIICKRPYNYGEDKNIRVTYDEIIFPKYKTWILSEDDNEFSPNFLEYMNYNLEKYADDDSIYAICGYHYPIKWNDIPQDRIYASFFYSPWGAGFWINKYKSATIEEIDLYLHSMSNIVKMAKHVPFLLNTVIGMRYSNYKYGDAIIRTRLFLENKACIFPTLTKVRNCGYDNTGVNCRDDGGVHAKQKIDDNFDYISDEIIEIPDLLHRYNEYYCVTFVDKLKSLIKYFCYLCKHTMRNLQESFDTDVKNG